MLLLHYLFIFCHPLLRCPVSIHFSIHNFPDPVLIVRSIYMPKPLRQLQPSAWYLLDAIIS